MDPAEAIESLNSSARDEAERLIGLFTVDLVNEANRLEAALNTEGASPEVTPAMIRDADHVVRRGFARRKRSGKAITARFAGLGGTAVLGIGASNMGTGPGQLAFAVGLLIAAIAVSYEFVSDR
ncbi:MAG: hypothetical protein QOF60_3379 [Actinomycetota bacterium]|jgi:hypothetical protein|nr:hypothetical protein [Actinomycetota bacterium]